MGLIVDSIIAFAKNQNAYTDLHIVEGSPIMGCAPTGYVPLNDVVVAPSDIHEFLSLPAIAGPDWEKKYNLSQAPIEVSQTLSTFRIRCSVYETLGREHRTCVAIRVLPIAIPDFDTLGLPRIVEHTALSGKGLFLITGPTGAGKTTTLASLLDRFNAKSNGHIVTIEQPIEYLLPKRRAIVSQCEIPHNAPSFADGVAQSMRHHPTVIAIGEVLDSQTAEAMLRAASTGHTVLATMHTRSCEDTVESLLQMFQGDDSARKSSLLASVLKGIVTQTLVPAIDGRRLILAYEIFLVNTPAAATAVSQGKITGIRQAMETGKAQGMCFLNDTLATLLAEKKISADTHRLAIRKE